MKREDDFFTVYFTDDFEPSDAEILYFERAIGCEIGIGDGFVNLYTVDPQRVHDLIDLIGDFYIAEVPGLKIKRGDK